ncbi:hypothetical protein [Paenibacillus sp. S02]|uniref:YxiF family protein n=1 Tax=Paenibacillus sp. S02 TaxID=2823904 RepID=UPI001C64805D|nr:hypothetical protein [Paenibacillus sp. S02]QYK68796.1 hypothetical protein KAI36_03949 [Paenibacillus sp. S02]
MEEKKEKLQKLLFQKEVLAERKKLKDVYLNDYHIILSDNQFIDYQQSNNLKRKGYEKVFSKENLSCTEYSEVLNWVNVNRSKLNSLVEKPVVLFYMDNISGGVLLSLELILNNILGSDIVLTSDLLVTTEDLKYGLCIEVEEHNYLITCWGLLM